MIRGIYRSDVSRLNNYLRYVGSFDFHFLSAPQKEIQNYLTLINPLDGYTWAFLLASVVAVTITLIMIDTNYAHWFETSENDIIHQSKHMCFCHLPL